MQSNDPPSLHSPQESDSESPIPNKKTRPPPRSPLASDPDLTHPYRRSNASLQNLFSSTTSLPSRGSAKSPSDSGTATPANGTVFSPAGSTLRSPSPRPSTREGEGSGGGGSGGHEAREIIIRAFSPHVSVLASQDTEELIRHKGIHGGLLELLRPFGEQVPGKVTIRDSAGASKSWEDFAVRFVGVKDGMESPRAVPPANRNSVDSSTAPSRNGQRTSAIQEYKPARLRTGGDIPQIEELVERHLTFAEEQSSPFHEADYINQKDPPTADSRTPSPFYLLYLRRLLSGLPLVPSETFSHPIASVIAISSRSPSPIEDLRTLYASSNTGEHRLPHWVHNEFLRYYLLVHDEDYDDLQKSMQLYEQMKRHFGLHCHLLRLRSKPCTSSSPSSPSSPASSSENNENESDESKLRLPMPTWLSSAEELAEITRRETSEEDDDDILTPWIFASDATNVRAFVREMVTQSIIPSMERASANWNDQVASRRRGISGRFMSLSKRFTAFGTSGGSRASSTPVGGGSGVGNYDSLQGFYRPDAPEAVMRRLADYSMMLRDFKLARGTYEILCQDFKNDKAWRHYAGANEMAVVSALIVATSSVGGGGSASASGAAKGSRVSVGSGTDFMVDQYLETAYYSYTTRVGAPYSALRTLVMAIELLRLRGGGKDLDEAAKWANRILEDRLVGQIGHVLLMERIGACYATDRKGWNGMYEKRRKAAFWNVLACDAWLRLEKGARAEECLREAERLYGLSEGQVQFDNMEHFLHQLQDAVKANRSGPQHLDGEDLMFGDEVTSIEPLQDENERLARRSSISSGGGAAGVPIIAPPMHGHRKSLSNAPLIPPPPPLQTSLEPLGGGGVPPTAYDVTTPGAAKQRNRGLSAASASTSANGTGIGGAMGLSPHVEEDIPMPPTPMSAARVLERRDPRDDGFE